MDAHNAVAMQVVVMLIIAGVIQTSHTTTLWMESAHEVVPILVVVGEGDPDLKRRPVTGTAVGGLGNGGGEEGVCLEEVASG